MYDIKSNYRDDDELRKKFFEFTKNVFPGLDFSEWYKNGFWTDAYIPFSIIESGKIISNVSISKMKIFLNGEITSAIQFGTVGTLHEFRKRGLSRYLMKYVISLYDDDIDLFYLFANNTVTEFYPKFGFKKVEEVIFQRSSNIPLPNYKAVKLNLANSSDKKLVAELINKRAPVSKIFSAYDYEFITWWYILNFHSNDLFYLPNENIIFIAGENNNELHIYDVIFDRPFNFEIVLPKVLKHNNYKAINYYFSPDVLNYQFDKTIRSADSPLFIRGNFNLEQRQFKYPYTAQT
jgi:GNAT superfamily N-acetyltransferase